MTAVQIGPDPLPEDFLRALASAGRHRLAVYDYAERGPAFPGDPLEARGDGTILLVHWSGRIEATSVERIRLGAHDRRITGDRPVDPAVFRGDSRHVLAARKRTCGPLESFVCTTPPPGYALYRHEVDR